MEHEHDHRILQHLAQYVTDNRKAQIHAVLTTRTRYVTIVLENIFQSQNASAAIRTCECMGLQDIHLIEGAQPVASNKKVLKGAHKWVNIERYTSGTPHATAACFENLRSKNYRILCAHPSAVGMPVEEVSLPDQPLAVVFGNELKGLSDFALATCDEKIQIPMFGFTKSYNLSVSVAITLYALMFRLRQSGRAIGLSEEEKSKITLAWYRKIVRRSALIEREFLRTIV